MIVALVLKRKPNRLKPALQLWCVGTHPTLLLLTNLRFSVLTKHCCNIHFPLLFLWWVKTKKKTLQMTFLGENLLLWKRSLFWKRGGERQSALFYFDELSKEARRQSGECCFIALGQIRLKGQEALWEEKESERERERRGTVCGRLCVRLCL